MENSKKCPSSNMKKNYHIMFISLILLLTNIIGYSQVCFDSEQKFKNYLSSRKDSLDSKEGIYLVNLSIELYDKKGMILATPAPEYKKYLIKTTDGYEFCSITNKAKNRAIFKKTENPNVYKYREISLLDVGMKDVFCNATFKGDMLSFVYKVTYDEANKVPQTSMKLGEWELLRFKCKKLK